MNLENAPHHWQARADNFYLRAMRHAYEISHEAELAALRDRLDATEDTWWAVATELREDGAAVVKPLTLARLDAYCIAYEAGRGNHWSMPPVLP